MEPWIEGLWKAVKAELSNMTSERTECPSGSSKETPDPAAVDVQLNLLSIADSQACESMGQSGKLANSASPSVSATQTAVSDVGPDSPSRRIGLAPRADGAVGADAAVASLTRSLPPLSDSALNIPALPPPYLAASLREPETAENVRTIDGVGAWVMLGLRSHSCFPSECWTVKQRESSRGSHIKGRSVDQGRFS